MNSRVRFLQPEQRYLDVIGFLLVVNQLIGSAHRAERRFQLAPRRVLEALARLQHRLLADDPRPANFLYFSESVGDNPVTADKLDRVASFVREADRVEERPLIL